MKSQPVHGTTIEDYEILSKLGNGSHSVVYEVKCLKCGSSHALKVVTKQNLRQKNLTRLLVNEMKLHNTLKHERIVKLLQCFEDSECIYLLTELCKGGELNTLVKSKIRPELPIIKKIFKQIVEGVKYLHDNMIIHRDLKLANIMITENGDIKIGDFGLAVQLKDCYEERETVCGTPNYMSPEILIKQPYNFEADVWSLGCILYTLLVGRPPFEGANAQDTMLNVTKGKYEMPAEIDTGGKDLIKELLKYNREERITMGNIIHHPFISENFTPPSPEKPPKPVILKGKENIKPKKFSIKKDSATIITRNLNTERLKPITHKTPQGYIRIDEDGIVELEMASRGKLMRISSNGHKITIGSKIVEGCIAEFNLSTLPPQFTTIYKYAYDFVNVLRSKTPKITLIGEGYKCCLMENEPSHNVEYYKKDGLKICYQIGGNFIDILLPDKKRLKMNPYKELKDLPLKIKSIVEEFFGVMKKCEEIEKQTEIQGGKFPLIVAMEGSSNYSK